MRSFAKDVQQRDCVVVRTREKTVVSEFGQGQFVGWSECSPYVSLLSRKSIDRRTYPATRSRCLPRGPVEPDTCGQTICLLNGSDTYGRLAREDGSPSAFLPRRVSAVHALFSGGTSVQRTRISLRSLTAAGHAVSNGFQGPEREVRMAIDLVRGRKLQPKLRRHDDDRVSAGGRDHVGSSGHQGDAHRRRVQKIRADPFITVDSGRRSRAPRLGGHTRYAEGWAYIASSTGTGRLSCRCVASATSTKIRATTASRSP